MSEETKAESVEEWVNSFTLPNLTEREKTIARDFMKQGYWKGQQQTEHLHWVLDTFLRETRTGDTRWDCCTKLKEILVHKKGSPVSKEISAYDLLKRLKNICYEKQRRYEDCGFSLVEIADVLGKLKGTL